MQFVLFNDFFSYRLEGSQAYVQSNFRSFNAALFEARENLRREVQPGCRSCNGPAFPRIDRLITLAVTATIFSRDIRRKRHVPKRLNRREEIRHRTKAYTALAKLSSGDRLC